jgi:hypothetical protein
LSQAPGTSSLFPIPEQDPLLIGLDYVQIRNTAATVILSTEFSIKQKFVRAISRFAVVLPRSVDTRTKAERKYLITSEM